MLQSRTPHGLKKAFEESTATARGLSREIASSSSSSYSSSSYVKNIPTDLPSYVSTCRGIDAVTNPATGQAAGMFVEGFFDESEYPEDETFEYKGGLTRTAANMGKISCLDASSLFSMRYGMVSVTVRLPQEISEGVYSPLAGRDDSANPDMVVFCVNPGDYYISTPGIYAAFTPSGIEFTAWSLGSKITIIDSVTNVQPGTDVKISFAWDYTRRISCGGIGQSMAILVNGIPTAFSEGPINPSGFDDLFEVEIGSDSSEEWETARFCFGDSPSGKNGMIGIVVRRIEIYKEPCNIPMIPARGYVGTPPTFHQHSDVSIGFSVVSARWVGVVVGDPDFKPAESIQVNLLETGTAGIENGVDLGAKEDDSYPQVPNGLPPGIREVRGNQ